MEIKEYLRKYKAENFFILDTHQDAMNEQEVGHQHADSDFVGYAYNIHRNNQLKKDSFFCIEDQENCLKIISFIYMVVE